MIIKSKITKKILFSLIGGLFFCISTPSAHAQSCGDGSPGLCIGVVIDYYVYAPIEDGPFGISVRGKRCMGLQTVNVKISPDQYGEIFELVNWSKGCHGSNVRLKLEGSFWAGKLMISKTVASMNGANKELGAYFPENYNNSSHGIKADPEGRGYTKLELSYSYNEE